MYAIEDFLSTASSYDDANNLDKLIEELHKIPNYQEVFNKLLEENPDWLSLAQSTRDKDGILHVFYLLGYRALEMGEPESTDMSLLTFSSGKDPAIKVLAKRKMPKHGNTPW